MHHWKRAIRPLRDERFLDETLRHVAKPGDGSPESSEREGSRVSIRTGGQIERLLWAAAEARRLRAEPQKAVVRPIRPGVMLALPPEQFTTEWQTALPEPA
jgi:hypothetical protein